MGYLTRLKTTLVKAVKTTFDSAYPEPDFRNLHVSIEFPARQQDYPGCWVDYNPIGNLKRVGINHVEFDEESGSGREFTRWRFQGEASFALVAMTSFERDRLHDEFVRVIAFGPEHSATSRFRQVIEDNEYLSLNMDFDEITVRGMSNTLGTPWQTDDMIYEVEIGTEVLGEFVADPVTYDLIKLTDIEIKEPYTDQQDDPYEGDGWV